MHIPDGFLNNQASTGLIVISLVVSGYALKKVKDSLFEKTRVLLPGLVTNIGEIGSRQVISRLKWRQQAEKKVENMAVVAAFVFAAQMVNFPVASGTSGHLIGGVLAAVVLGPWSAVLAIASVLSVQALIFGDGGITALGANVFNMAIVAGLGGYYIYLAGLRIFKNKYFAIFFASWLSVILASVFCSLELAFAGTAELSSVFHSMVLIHALIGIGEGIITVLAVKFLFNYSNNKNEQEE